MARANTALPKEWRQFANHYGADRAYWYVPKGLAVSTGSLKSRLSILKEFEDDRAWRDCQQGYVQRLNDEKISVAAAEWNEGGAPRARMLKQVFVMLGLAWVDPGERIEITPVGEKFLASKDPDGVLSDQLEDGPQYSTTVGPIDLLTVDTKTGEYVVIELKKGRSADKVYGQCSRYMGWVRKNLAANGAKVHGAIVARQIDNNLKAARDAHDTKVYLIEFEMKIGATTV